MISLSILKIFLPAVLSFMVGIIMTLVCAPLMYRFRLWKRVSRLDNSEQMSDAFKQMQNDKVNQAELGTPRVGGVIVWGSVVVVVLFMFFLSKFVGGPAFLKLDFLSRGQTLLPLLALLFGGLFGLFEDLLEIYIEKFERFREGLPKSYLISAVVLIGLFSSLWFFNKLGMRGVYVPFLGYWNLGFAFIPFFILVVLGTFSSRVIDGIDGLAGGVMTIAFGTYGVIAYIQNQIDIAALCFVIAGSILAFLWFNVPPAKYYLGETGMLALTLCLSIIAFLTDQVFILLVVGFMLVLTSVSSFTQIISKRYFGKKVFRIAPIHWHFHALGWSREGIVMRYWIITLMLAVLSVIIVLTS
jgi:phospho-N-acetylmuramoyl-pentapeptide-transferase